MVLILISYCRENSPLSGESKDCGQIVMQPANISTDPALLTLETVSVTLFN